MTYPGVGSLRGDPRRLRGDPQPPGASCDAPVSRSALYALYALYGRLPRAGGLPGQLPREGVQKGGR
jgi:hypothetical protein